MLNPSLRRTLGATAVSIALAGAGAGLAHASLAPDQGPAAGNTTVTIPGPPVPAFTQVSRSDVYSLALTSTGEIFGWGSGSDGVFGNGTTDSEVLAVRVAAALDVTFTQISAANNHVLALAEDGQVYAWGDNSNGQLGDGTTTNRYSPIQVEFPADVSITQVVASYYSGYSLALTSEGEIYAWGNNGTGALGDGTRIDRHTPVLVHAPVGVKFTQLVQVQEMVGEGGYSAALGDDGLLYVWGYDSHSSRFGTGEMAGRVYLVPTSVPKLPAGVKILQAAGGGTFMLATADDGNTYSWGSNQSGELGRGFTSGLFEPQAPGTVELPAGVTLTQVAASGGHDAFSLALGADGIAYSWGANVWGVLGNGVAGDRSTPGEIAVPPGVSFTQMSAGYHGALAVGTDGQVYWWGLGSASDSFQPVPLTMDAVVTEVTFDGLPGISLVENADGSWTVDTPAHVPGPVDVVVSWTLNGVAQEPIRYPGGFTYTPDPVAATISNPADQSITEGEQATFVVTAAGEPAPSVRWEVSRDGGLTWEEIGADPGATASADGLTLTVVGSAANDGYQYRAVAENGVGAPAASAPATLTVIPEPVAPTITAPADQSVQEGKTATFVVAAAGEPVPSVTWEVSRDGGLTWEEIGADPGATASADGLTLTVVGSATNDGYQYRAIAENGVGVPAVSPAALLTVTEASVPNGQEKPNAKDEKTANSELAFAGADTNSAYLIAALVALLLGSGLVGAHSVAKRRSNR